MKTDPGFPHDYGQYCECPECGGKRFVAGVITADDAGILPADSYWHDFAVRAKALLANECDDCGRTDGSHDLEKEH